MFGDGVGVANEDYGHGYMQEIHKEIG